MQKITVRTLLRAFALAPAVALGWGWGRGRAKAAPATPVDPLTVDANGVTVKGQLNADKVLLPGLKLEGSGGRNYFLDEESKKEGVNLGAGLRVGSAWWVNGIYSENGPVHVGSQNDIIWLRGGVGIGKTAPTAIPEGTLNVVNVNAKGTLDAAKVAVPGTKIEGTGGRNFFLDEESKKEGVDLGGGLRVGSAWNTNGIYSQKGPVVVGSENKIIWLAGGVGIGGTAPTGIPEGGIRAKSIGFGEEDLRIIRGVIYQRQSHGRGFTLEAKTKEGLYKIIFTVEFPNDFFTPIATSFSGDRRVQIKETDKKYCIIRVGNVHSNADQDGSFTFMVIGPV